MSPTPHSYAFIDWIGERLRRASGGMLGEGSLFFHRESNVAQKIRSSLASGLGYCCEVSNASFHPEAERDPNNRFADMEVEVVITRGPMAKVDTTPIAESVYADFVGRCTTTTTPQLVRVGDVWVGDLEASVDAATGAISHSFRLITKIDLTPQTTQ